MLETLRKHSRSWGTKVIFGGIALIFALYFGFSFNQGPPGGPAAPVAKVNGQAIPLGVFTQTVQNQTAMLERFNPGKIPEETYKVVENQVLQNLIGKTLFAQEAHRLGLRVPDAQLAEEIRNNPVFQKDGRFSESFYLDQFKPFFERQNGEDYEEALRKDLLVEKLREALEKASVISANEVRTQKALVQTQLNVKKWGLPIQKDNAKARDQAWKLAQEWIATDKIPENTPDAPKPTLTETGLKSVSELIQELGREDSLPPLQCLLEIQAGKKCDSPFQIGNQIVAVQLLERKTLDSPDEAVRLSEQLAQGRRYQTLTAVQNLLTREAKIETYLTKK